MQRCWTLYAVPAALAGIAVALASGPGADAGVLIRAGLIGAMLFVCPALDEQQRAELRTTLEGVLPGRRRSIESLRDSD